VTPVARLLALCLLLPLPALAWNAAGHRLSAALAWEGLDAPTRAEVAILLRAHPDHPRWLVHVGRNDDPVRIAFIEASTWPDDIRRDPRFYDAGRDTATPTLPGFPDMERRRRWHYVDRPLPPVAGGPLSTGELDRRIGRLAATLADRRASLQSRSYALPWLIHLVADAHQPLHTASRLDAEGRSDEGGNALTVATPLHPRLGRMRLHAYWDDLPGPPWLRGSRLEAALRVLERQAPPPGGPEVWIEESWQLARDTAYPPAPEIDRAFDARARDIARRRIAEAGQRLADLLNGLPAGAGRGERGR